MKRFTEILKEVNKDTQKYRAYFNKMLKKYGIKSPNQLSKEEKKKFYDEVDKGWMADKETD